MAVSGAASVRLPRGSDVSCSCTAPGCTLADHHAKPGSHLAQHQPQPIRLSELARLQHLAEPFLLRLVVAGDQHQVVGGGLVQLVAQLRDVAAEALHRFDAQMTRGFAARAGQGA